MSSHAATGLRSYADAVALVTGAGSGIGEGLANALAARGAVAIATDRRPEEAARVAARIAATGLRAEHQLLDVRDAEAFENVVAGIFERHGRLDYLFNNAGIGIGGEAQDLTLEDWRALVDVNVLGVVHGVRAAYPRMIAQRFGHIVNTASIAGLAPTPMVAAYCMTKHAVVGLSRSLRAEAAHYGVRVSVVCPGVVRTAIINGGAFGRLATSLPEGALERLADVLRAMPPDVFAAKVLRLVARNRATIIVPWWWRGVAWLHRVSPGFGDWSSALAFRIAKKRLQ